MRSVTSYELPHEADDGYAIDARGLAFHRFIKTHARAIDAMTFRRAGGNPALQQELRQRALIALWHIDPSRCTDADNTLLFTRMRDRMRNGARADRRSRAIGGIPCVSDTAVVRAAKKEDA